MILHNCKIQNAYDTEHDVQPQSFRPTITDVHDKYCGDCDDIYLTQSQYTKVNLVAVTTILVLHVGDGGCEHA